MNIEPAQLRAEAEDVADVRADADIREGRVVDHAVVSAWLAKWGTAAETTIPAEWLE